ncbi:MAG: methyltransferase domain-containing protein [Steroidobacteraceae bacterium]|jgi:precorrin-6B methylase 2|nr:methyltransferase domain-containing protein [Steroidobacteraceae bacterium]
MPLPLPLRRTALLVLLLLLAAVPAAAASAAVPGPQPVAAAGPAGDAAAPGYRFVEPSLDGIGKVYMGREIAQVMGWQGAPWLEREEREQEERGSRLIAALQLQPGMVVADVGAGSGWYTRRLAPRVGPQGRVYAVDVQPEMVAMLGEIARRPGFGNVVPVLGTTVDVKLPAASLDLSIMVDVYHELEFPWEMLASLVRATKPGGRIVFVEYRAEDAFVPIKTLHKMTEAQVRREASVFPLEWERTVRTLPWQHVVVFRRK